MLVEDSIQPLHSSANLGSCAGRYVTRDIRWCHAPLYIEPFVDRYEVLDCVMDPRQAIIIHGDDVLAHRNWEIDEKFLRRYG